MNDPVAEDSAGDPSADGRRTRWDAHRSARREELIDAAIRAISRFGPEVGMDRIAALAGTSKAVVYRYFPDKTGLYRAVTGRVVDTIIAALRSVTDSVTGSAAEADGGPDARALLRGSVEAYLALLEATPALYRFVVAHPWVDAPADGTDGPSPTTPGTSGTSGTSRTFSDLLAGMLDEQFAAHLRALGLDPRRAAPWGAAVVGFLSAASTWWLDHPDAMTREDLAAYLAALLWGGAAGVHQLAGAPADARPPASVFPALPNDLPNGLPPN